MGPFSRSADQFPTVIWPQKRPARPKVARVGRTPCRARTPIRQCHNIRRDSRRASNTVPGLGRGYECALSYVDLKSEAASWEVRYIPIKMHVPAHSISAPGDRVCKGPRRHSRRQRSQRCRQSRGSDASRPTCWRFDSTCRVTNPETGTASTVRGRVPKV